VFGLGNELVSVVLALFGYGVLRVNFYRKGGYALPGLWQIYIGDLQGIPLVALRQGHFQCDAMAIG
jgi:hypothetical protein